SAAAVTLVCAFFGLCTLTDDLPGGRAVGEQIGQWWLLTLKSLQATPDPAGLLARARVRIPVQR
ncbi:TetR/AcrR family transcriptional regulator, partial [Streptomyces argenteolus]